MLKFFGFMSATGPPLIYIQWHNMTKFDFYLKGMGLLGSLVEMGYLYLYAIMKQSENNPPKKE